MTREVRASREAVAEIPNEAKRSELDEETKKFLEDFSATFSSIAHLSIPEQRATIKEMFLVPESLLEPVEAVEDRVVSGKNGPINIRLFYPKNEGPLSIIVYFHRSNSFL